MDESDDIRRGVAARLRSARILAGFQTAQEFADKHDIPQATYQTHEQGSRGLKVEVAQRYADALGNCDAAWLLTGHGRSPEIVLSNKNKLTKNRDGVADIPTGLRPRPIRAVRVIGGVAGGILRGALEWPEDRQFDIMVDVNPRHARLPLFALKVEGNSMDMEFPEGSTVICAKVEDFGEDYEIPSGTFVVACRNGHGEFEATIKQFKRDAAGEGWLMPLSTASDQWQPVKARSLTDRTDDDANDEVRIWAIVVTKQVDYDV